MGGGGDTKEDVGVMGSLSPSVEVDSHGWASPLILGGPTSPSGSGEGFLFLAVLATEKTKERREKGISESALKRPFLCRREAKLATEPLLSSPKAHPRETQTRLRAPGALPLGARPAGPNPQEVRGARARPQRRAAAVVPARLKGDWCPGAPVHDCAGKGKPRPVPIRPV